MVATLESVARRAKVSRSTVSRILSNTANYSFKSETRERVLAACRDLGYTPNLPARALASGKSQIIGFAVPRTQDSPFSALGSLQILASLEEACSDLGYHVLISSPHLNGDDTDLAFKNLIRSGYLDGIIVDGHFAIGPLMNVIREHDVPCVVVGYHPHDYFVRADNHAGCRKLLHYLHDLGHRRIGVIKVDEAAVIAGTERLAGIAEAAAELNLDFAKIPLVDGGLSQEGGARAAQNLITNHPDLTALLALNDRMAIGALRRLTELGIDVPGEVSVVGYDNLPQSADILPGLTTVDQQFASLGNMLVDMLLALLAGDTPESIVLPTELVIRGSTAPPRSTL